MPLFNCSFTLSGAQSPCSMYLGMIRIVLNVSAPCMLQQYARMGFAYICLELQVCKIRGACVFLSVFMLSASCLLVFTGDPFLSLGLTRSLPLSYEWFPFMDSTNTYKCKVLKHVPCPPLTPNLNVQPPRNEFLTAAHMCLVKVLFDTHVLCHESLTWSSQHFGERIFCSEDGKSHAKESRSTHMLSRWLLYIHIYRVHFYSFSLRKLSLEKQVFQFVPSCLRMRNLEVVTAPRSVLNHIQVLDGVAGQRWASQIMTRWLCRYYIFNIPMILFEKGGPFEHSGVGWYLVGTSHLPTSRFMCWSVHCLASELIEYIV